MMGGRRHGSHTMAGVGHNHSFPHMLNLSYREYGISSSTGTSINSRLYTVECSRVSLQMQLSAVQLGWRMWRFRVLALR